MLGNKIKDVVNDQVKIQEAEMASKTEAERQEVYKKSNKVVKLINAIKENIQLLSESKKKVVMSGDKTLIKVTDMKEVFGKNEYENYMYSSKAMDVDFIEFFSRDKLLPLSSELKSLSNWLESEGIQSIFIRHEHDGCGQTSWNSYWLKLKN